MKKIISAILCALMLTSVISFAPLAAEELVDSGIDYRDSTETLSANPGRGQVADGGWAMCSKDGVTPVKNPTGNINTLMYDLRCFSAGNDFKSNGKGKTGVGGKDIPINEQTLSALGKTLENARKNGTLIIFRFAYAWDENYGNEPSDFDMLLHHIEQLSEVINKYTDVVISMEAGMVGPWGEMHSSAYAESSYAAQVLGKWLECLDENVTVQSRSPKYILAYYNMTPREFINKLPITTDNNFYRLGMYNDGYLGTTNDYGTFYDNSATHLSREQAKIFLSHLDGVPYGGELAYVTESYAKANSILYKANYNMVEEFYLTHLSYLRNIGDLSHPLTKCMSEIKFDKSYDFEGMPNVSEYYGLDLQKFTIDHMGYRFVLRDSKLTASAAPGGDVRLTGKIENTGFGSVCSDTEAELMLTKSGEYYSCSIDLDVGEDIKSCNEYSYDYTLSLPRNIPAGNYDIYLRITHKNDELSGDNLGAIAFANDGIYRRALGANKLGTVTVIASDAVSDNEGFCIKGSGESGQALPTVISGYTSTAAADIGQKVTVGYFIEGATDLIYRVNGKKLETVNGRAEFVMSAETMGDCTVTYKTPYGKDVTKTFMTLTVAGHNYKEISRTDSTCSTEGKAVYSCADCGNVIEAILPLTEHEYKTVLGEDICQYTCIKCADTAPINGEYDTAMPGAAAENPIPQFSDASKIMIVGKDIDEYIAKQETDTLYFAVNVKGLNGEALVGGLHTVTRAAGASQNIDSNASGNMSHFTGYELNEGDGTYIFSLDFSLVNWVNPNKFGTVSILSINDSSVTVGAKSKGLENTRFTSVGVYETKPYYDVYFCDENGKVISHSKGEYSLETGGLKSSAVKLKTISSLYPDRDMKKETDDGYIYNFKGWKNANGSTGDHALGTMVMIPDYEEVCSHSKTKNEGTPATCTKKGTHRVRCEICGKITEESAIPALGHDFASEYTVDIQPTDTTPGTKSIHCTRCDEKKDTVIVPPLKTPAERFTDVSEGAWYYDAIDYAITNSIFNGMSNTSFAPNMNVTRGMLVRVLYNLEGSPDVSKEENPFTDVSNTAWYYNSVKWAANRGIVNGISPTEFAPTADITREQLATLIYRYAEYKDYSVNTGGNLSIFPDSKSASQYAKIPLSWAVGEELITGNNINGKVMLDPRGNATRAQTALILMRFCNNDNIKK